MNWKIINQIYFSLSGAAMISRIVLHQGDQSFCDKPLVCATTQVTVQSMAWPYYTAQNITKGFIPFPTKPRPRNE